MTAFDDGIVFTLSGVLKKSEKIMTNIYNTMRLIISGCTENKPHQKRFSAVFTKVCQQVLEIQRPSPGGVL